MSPGAGMANVICKGPPYYLFQNRGLSPVYHPQPHRLCSTVPSICYVTGERLHTTCGLQSRVIKFKMSSSRGHQISAFALSLGKQIFHVAIQWQRLVFPCPVCDHCRQHVELISARDCSRCFGLYLVFQGGFQRSIRHSLDKIKILLRSHKQQCYLQSHKPKLKKSEIPSESFMVSSFGGTLWVMVNTHFVSSSLAVGFVYF
jgi:hypothetical protein